MYGVVSDVHQREQARERERERKAWGDVLLHYFLQAFTVFAGDARHCCFQLLEQTLALNE